MSCSILTLQILPGLLSPTESYFKELLHAMVRVGIAEVCRAGQQAGRDLGRVDAAVLSLKFAGRKLRQGFL